MQLLTKESDYAVRALICIATAPDQMATPKADAPPDDATDE